MPSMREVLREKTNTPFHKVKKHTTSDKESVLNFLKEVMDTTKDYSLKYDITKCIEIIVGKENQEVLDLMSALEQVATEKEEITEKNMQLIAENEYLKKKYCSQDE